MMAQLSLERKCLLSAKPTNTERLEECCASPPAAKVPTFHKNLNWSVKHQTVITCGEPGEICKHPVCGVPLRPLLSSLHHTKTKPRVDSKAGGSIWVFLLLFLYGGEKPE